MIGDQPNGSRSHGVQVDAAIPGLPFPRLDDGPVGRWIVEVWSIAEGGQELGASRDADVAIFGGRVVAVELAVMSGREGEGKGRVCCDVCDGE